MYWAEGGRLLEDNPAIRLGLEKMTFTHYKTYRLYDKKIDLLPIASGGHREEVLRADCRR